MVKKSIDLLKSDLSEIINIDMGEYGLEVLGEEVVSKFIGLELHSAFQPIYDIRLIDEVGFEALLRPSIGSDSVAPSYAFELAETQGNLVKLDRVARTLHMLNFLRLPNSKALLFLNVHPKLLVSVNAHGKVFERILHAHSVPTQRVVIEILESAIEVQEDLNEAVTNYHDRGYLIAIDDFGRQHSNLDRLWHLSPDYVKLDLDIIHQAESNPKVQKILPKLVSIIQDLGARVIIEGIENSTQLQIALDSGANYLQGYFLNRPAAVAHWKNKDSQAAVKLFIKEKCQ